MSLRLFTAVATAAALLLSVASAAPPAAAPGYRSVFDGYRAFREQPVASWREANDLVGRIGGWQAYAREVQAGASAASGAQAGHGHTP